MAENAEEDNPHGIQMARGTRSLTITNDMQVTATISFGKTFKKIPFVIAVATNIPGGYPFVLYRVTNKTTTGANLVFRENTDRVMSGTLEIEWFAIDF